MRNAKLSRKEAERYGRTGLDAFNYGLPDIEGGTSFIYAELTGEHGERTTTNRSRIYYITEGSGEFIVNGKKIKVEAGDVISLQPHTTYNYWPDKNKTLKTVLVMELLDISKLPKK
jgi:quercetin dioxygenase-like cupin family protein